MYLLPGPVLHVEHSGMLVDPCSLRSTSSSTFVSTPLEAPQGIDVGCLKIQVQGFWASTHHHVHLAGRCLDGHNFVHRPAARALAAITLGT